MADKKIIMVALNGARSNKDVKPKSSNEVSEMDLKRMIMLSHDELGPTSSKVASGDIVQAKIFGRIVDKGEEGIKLQIDRFQVDDGTDEKIVKEREHTAPSPS